MKTKCFLLMLLFASILLSCGGGVQRSQTGSDNEAQGPLDFSAVWMAYQDNVYGYVGDNFERFYFLIDSMQVDAEDTLLYHVWGKYRIKWDIIDYEGQVRVMDISEKETHFSPELEHYDAQVYDLISKWELKSTSICIREGETINGQMASTFYILDGKAVFDDIDLVSDPYCNNQFTGTLISPEHGEQKCRWGAFRIPDSEDLDIGAAEFSPADEYLGNGWWSYREASREGTDEGWEYEKRCRWSPGEDSLPRIPVQVRPFVRSTEKAPVSVKELLAGFRFGMNDKEYRTAYDKLERIECDQIKLIVNNTYFQASGGTEYYANGQLYYKSLYLNYKGVRGDILTKADFEAVATYFKGVYGADSLHHMYTELPISEFPTHHWIKDNLYFSITWVPEGEVENFIALEYINGPVYWEVMNRKK